MRLTLMILFYVAQAVLGLAFVYLTYLLTYTLDLFPWGSSKADRFFLVVLPFRLIPIIAVVSIIKFFVAMGLQKMLQLTLGYKWSFILPIASGLICHLLLGVETTWLTIAISGTTTVAIAIETARISKRVLAVTKAISHGGKDSQTLLGATAHKENQT